jgi:hypothetical protein
MRCQDCAKFASLELGDVESDCQAECVDQVGNVTSWVVAGNVRIVLTCADCGQELKEMRFEPTIGVELAHKDDCPNRVEVDLEFEPEAVDKFEPPRAKRQTHYYGAAGTATLTCAGCAAKVEAEWVEWVKSSQMEEL